MKTNDVLEKLRWRYATKMFDSGKKVSDELWDQVEESLVLTPSSFGLQPWKFIVVTDQAVKEQLVEHSWNQAQVADCSHLVVLTALQNLNEADIERFIVDTHEKRGGELVALNPYKDMMNGFVAAMSEEEVNAWAKNQVYIALGQLMTTAAMLDLDACPMEGIVPAKYDEVLGLEGGRYATVLACPVGYRSEEDKHSGLAKVRYSRAEVLERL